jgi:hypothetical protein
MSSTKHSRCAIREDRHGIHLHRQCLQFLRWDLRSKGLSHACPNPYALSLTLYTSLTGSALDNLTLGTGNITADVTSFSFGDGSGFSLNQVDAPLGSFTIKVLTEPAAAESVRRSPESFTVTVQ